MKRRHVLTAATLLAVALAIAWWILRDSSSIVEPAVEPRGADRLEESRLPEVSTERVVQENPQAPAGELYSQLITTVDEFGRSIAGARLTVLHADGAWDAVGETDAAGILALDANVPETSIFHATAEGYCTAKKEAVGREITLVLEKAAAIEGRVVFMDGSLVGPGITIVARPVADYRFEAADLDAAAAGFPALSTTQTDEESHFVLAGLHPETIYEIDAGGKGTLEARRTRVVPADAGFVEIAVTAVAGVVVDLVEEDGRPVRASPRLITADPITCSGCEGGIPSNSNAHRWLERDWFTDTSGYKITKFFAYAGRRRPKTFRLAIDLPCYERKEVTLQAFSLIDHGLKTVDVVLEPTCEGDFVDTSISIRWSRAVTEVCAVTYRDPSRAPVGAIAFPVAGGESVYVPIETMQTIVNVPVPASAGQPVYLTIPGREPFRPLVDEYDESGETRHIEFDLADQGAVVAVVADEEGLGPEWANILLHQLEARDPVPQRVEFLEHRSAAFVAPGSCILPALGPGNYTIRMTSSSWGSGSSSRPWTEPKPFVIEPGEVTEVVFRLAETR